MVVDDPNTHSVASLYEAFPPEEARRLAGRIQLHFTPKHGSWLNIGEVEFAALTKQCVGRRIGDIESLRDWKFTTADARVKFERLYPRIPCV